jgi:hypothetical protein
MQRFEPCLCECPMHMLCCASGTAIILFTCFLVIFG